MILLRQNKPKLLKTKLTSKMLEINNPKHFTFEDGVYSQVSRGMMDGSILDESEYKASKLESFRLFNTYESAQLLRFWTVVNWIRDCHDKHVPVKMVLDLGCGFSKLYQVWYNNGNFMNWPAIEYWG